MMGVSLCWCAIGVHLESFGEMVSKVSKDDGWLYTFQVWMPLGCLSLDDIDILR